jgi:hypothetical protein
MTPEAAVARLAEIIAAHPEATGDEIYAAMAEAGVPDAEAGHAYDFTQIAWGRVLLDGMGIDFSPDYLRFDAAGEVVESGRLAEQPYFAAAMAAAPGAMRSPGFAEFAATSADFAAVNNALNAGSRPEDLACGPAALFREAPSPGGMEKVERLLAQRARDSAGQAPAAADPTGAKKPWWKVW